MYTLSKVNHNALKELLGRSYESVQSRMRKILTKEEMEYFATTTSNNRERKWAVDNNNNSKSFATASEEEQDMASDFIRQKVQAIKPKLHADAELRNIAEAILTIPSEEQIYIFTDASGMISISIAQWGFSSAYRSADINPLDKVVSRSKKNHTLVEVQVGYSDGVVAANKSLFFLYKEVVRPISTDEKGSVHLGQLTNGSVFEIVETPHPNQNDSKIKVIENQSVYIVNIDYYISPIIKVVNQDGEEVSNIEITAKHNGSSQTTLSNDSGECFLEKIKLDDNPLVASTGNDQSLTKSFQLYRNSDVLIFEITQVKKKNIRLIILDKDDGESVVNYPISITTIEGERKGISDNNGLIVLDQIPKQGNFKVSDGKRPENEMSFEVEDQEKDYIFKVNRPKIEQVEIYLLDHKKIILPNVSMYVLLGTSTHEKVTNEEGKVCLDKELFTHNQKVPVHIFKKKDNQKPKTYKKSFTYKENKTKYYLRLRKFNKLLLLLLLLPLLLLLLLRFEKNIIVQTVLSANGTPVGNVEVDYSYDREFLYDEGQFFTKERIKNKKTSDANGLVQINKLLFSAYSYIFSHFSPFTLFANEGCFASDTMKLTFHRIKNLDTITLIINPILLPLDLQVVDEEDRFPLNKAKAHIIVEQESFMTSDSTISNANGQLLFPQLPKCGRVKELSIELKGYYPKIIEAKKIQDFLNDPKQRIIELKPIKEKIEFFVISCLTKEPLADAIATITIENNLKKTKQTKYTNIVGKGKGEYDGLPILSEISIIVKKPNLYKPGHLGKKYTVEDFIKLPDSLRTICLEPETNTFDFINTDESTNAPLAGVTNVIRIFSRNGSRDTTALSNVNGVFTVAARIGEKITIVGTFEPYYHPNDYTINNADVETLLKSKSASRKIPLKPKMINLQFRTLDAETSEILPDVNLNIYIDGILHSLPNNSGAGIFEIEAKFSSVISIEAEKTGYSSNTTKIKDKAINILQTALQSERDIYLSLPPCGTTVDGGRGKGNFSKEIPMGTKNGEFIFEFTTDVEADNIAIYCARKNDISPASLIDEIFIATGRDIWEKKRYKFNGCNIITVVVNGKSSNWEYKVNCPL